MTSPKNYHTFYRSQSKKYFKERVAFSSSSLMGRYDFETILLDNHGIGRQLITRIDKDESASPAICKSGLACIAHYVCNALAHQDQSNIYLETLPATKDQWAKCRSTLTKLKDTYVFNLASTTRQTKKAYINDVTTFFMKYTSGGKIEFLLGASWDSFRLIPGLQVEAIRMLDFTKSTLKAVSESQKIDTANRASTNKEKVATPDQKIKSNSSKTESPIATGQTTNKNDWVKVVRNRQPNTQTKIQLNAANKNSKPKSRKPLRGTYDAPNGKAPATISRRVRVWLKTDASVSTDTVKSWTTNWQIEESSLEIIHMTKQNFVSTFCVSFTSNSNTWKSFIPTGVTYANYRNKTKPLDYNNRIPIKTIFLSKIGLNVTAETAKEAVNKAFKNIDTTKTELYFIEAKYGKSNKKPDYKNGYVKLTGKEPTSLILQDENLPCNVYPWHGRQPMMQTTRPLDDNSWNGYQSVTLSNDNKFQKLPKAGASAWDNQELT